MKSRMDPRFYRRKSIKTLAKKKYAWTENISGKQNHRSADRLGVCGRVGGAAVRCGWRSLHSSRRGKTPVRRQKEETGGILLNSFFFGCQRKSVWCASSSRKCIDVRHRHSSPPAAERLTVACPIVFFSFSLFFIVPVQETCKVNTVGLHSAYVGREILLFLSFHCKHPEDQTLTPAVWLKNIGFRFLWPWRGGKKLLLVSWGSIVKDFSKKWDATVF